MANEFRDDLPSECPPADAREISGAETVYRLVKNNPPIAGDFISRREQQPSAYFRNISECIVRGLSVFSHIEDIEGTLLLPKFRKSHFLCRVKLSGGAGKIKQTFKPSHHTWWPYNAYNILEVCEVVKK